MSKETVIVSGASGNLGSAVVHHFLQKGVQVIGLVHHKKEKSKIDNYKEVELDLTNEEEVQNKLQELITEYQKIDTAILTAGGFKAGDLKHTRVKDLRFQYQLNFISAYTVTEALLPHFKKKGAGKLFFIGSKPGMDTTKGKGAVAYSLAKSQLFQLANIINSTFKKDDISAHIVIPSTIDTPQNREAVPDADFSKWEKPEDIAAIIEGYSNTDKKSKLTIVIEEELGNV